MLKFSSQSRKVTSRTPVLISTTRHFSIKTPRQSKLQPTTVKNKQPSQQDLISSSESSPIITKPTKSKASTTSASKPTLKSKGTKSTSIKTTSKSTKSLSTSQIPSTSTSSLPIPESTSIVTRTEFIPDETTITSFKFPSPLIEAILLEHSTRFVMYVYIPSLASPKLKSNQLKQHTFPSIDNLDQNAIFKCHSPNSCFPGSIGNIKLKNIPCLISKSPDAGKPNRKTDYTVEAISLQLLEDKNKEWIGINQSHGVNRYVEHFLKNGGFKDLLLPIGECVAPLPPKELPQYQVDSTSNTDTNGLKMVKDDLKQKKSKTKSDSNIIINIDSITSDVQATLASQLSVRREVAVGISKLDFVVSPIQTESPIETIPSSTSKSKKSKINNEVIDTIDIKEKKGVKSKQGVTAQSIPSTSNEHKIGPIYVEVKSPLAMFQLGKYPAHHELNKNYEKVVKPNKKSRHNVMVDPKNRMLRHMHSITDAVYNDYQQQLIHHQQKVHNEIKSKPISKQSNSTISKSKSAIKTRATTDSTNNTDATNDLRIIPPRAVMLMCFLYNNPGFQVPTFAFKHPPQTPAGFPFIPPQLTESEAVQVGQKLDGYFEAGIEFWQANFHISKTEVKLSKFFKLVWDPFSQDRSERAKTFEVEPSLITNVDTNNDTIHTNNINNIEGKRKFDNKTKVTKINATTKSKSKVLKM